MTVYEVLYYDPKSAGAAGDCTHVARFRNLSKATAFASGKTCYGSPATVQTCEDVPARLVNRWSFMG